MWRTGNTCPFVTLPAIARRPLLNLRLQFCSTKFVNWKKVLLEARRVTTALRACPPRNLKTVTLVLWAWVALAVGLQNWRLVLVPTSAIGRVKRKQLHLNIKNWTNF